MQRSILKLFQSRVQKQQSVDSSDGVVSEGDACSVASQDIFKVVSDGNTSRLRSLIKKNRRRLKKLDRLNATPLHHAAGNGQLELMQMIMDGSSPEALNVADVSGNTPLHWATKKHQTESIKLLLSRGANPNILNVNLIAPLHWALHYLLDDLVTIFLECSNTNINLEGEGGNTPILLACYKDNPTALKILIEKGGDICKVNNMGCMPVHAAAFSGSKLCLEMIIKRGEQLGYLPKNHINFINNEKSSPLHLAVQSRDVEMIKMCIEYGAQIDLKQSDNCTALHIAAIQGATEIIELLMSAYSGEECLINASDENKETLLHRAALFDHDEMTDYLISKGAIIDSVDIEGRTPLILATSRASWKIVNLLISKGANIQLKDHLGRSFLHLTVLHPGGLQHLNEEFLKMKHIRDLLTDEDHEGCTPLHYACKQGMPLTVNILLDMNVSVYAKSRDKKSPLHFAASDYKGWTPLHHAALGGYSRTMEIILNTNMKATDKVNDKGDTALHLAAREGHARAVKLLLDANAKILLNESEASFLHEAIHNERKDVVKIVILHKRWEESISTFSHFSSINKCAILEMVEYLPDCLKLVLDNCIVKSPEDKGSKDFFGMVRHNRVELLSHPVCTQYLLMKWMAYGLRAHILNLAVYSLGLIPLTLLVTNLEPDISFDEPLQYGPFDNKKSYFIKVCMSLVFIMSLFGICKEIIQLFQQKLNYLMDYSNLLDWAIYTTSLIFVSSLLVTLPVHLQWHCGAIAILLAWTNFLFYLQRQVRIFKKVVINYSILGFEPLFENYGIYIVMFWEILKTLIRIIVVFFFLMLAFGLSFHVLLGSQETYGTPYLSVMQTFSMMLGDVNYREAFLEPMLVDKLPFPFLSFLILILFSLLIPILLMNLLIGLAVGDIAEVQKFAAMKRIAMQINLHTNLEKKLPYWFLNRVDQQSMIIYPNRSRFGGVMSIRRAKKQKGLTGRLKDTAILVEKQHDLLKQIAKKMEVISVVEDEDLNDSLQSQFRKEHFENTNSKWDTVFKAVKS
ncbi:hypothetical protein Chor_002818 [Crotalus horridus]